ncbi:MAG: bifunctional 2-polyprenyl-6-hydroxyphenol methylase/3-demethylubiquinol 3-O-methyltransferase UbiG [Pelagibacteraceae bacterium]|jgi:2-polyprenyl-6-hydroxyphenyl methylase / 3-demethylubiquinone-9 3-methyltransferase|nr:bifunctional 2-polyprenyl-6-hydroxyphenol methylase/3-demethylubiquinol 3-O-methyltransferase UbiG [Pelagibacteraceae bacterium]
MSTINKDEINKFSKIANEWWDINGKFKPLHIFNPIRIEYILDVVLSHFKINKEKKLPLKNLKILDIGCGGGLISEPMSRLGADVTGIDASHKNIQVAKLHAKKNNIKINYLNTVPENLNRINEFDIVLNLEVVEHVENLDLYLSSCFKLLKKNRIMFTATINRTLTSYIKAIVGAEYILRWLPIGTHDWNKFIKPEELEKKLTDLNFSITDLTGLNYNPVFQEWKKTKDMSVNYIIAAKKN